MPLGATIDDAAGEAFDKVARVLGLPFPGGPHIDRAATAGDRSLVTFPRSKYRDGTSDFSFSGLKTAVARWVEAREAAGEPVPVADVAASFQEAVADVLTRKAVAACQVTRCRPPGYRRWRGRQLPAAGAGTGAVRERPVCTCGCRGRGLCTDNGAMVAALGAELVARGATPSGLDFAADSSLPVTTITAV